MPGAAKVAGLDAGRGGLWGDSRVLPLAPHGARCWPGRGADDLPTETVRRGRTPRRLENVRLHRTLAAGQGVRFADPGRMWRRGERGYEGVEEGARDVVVLVGLRLPEDPLPRREEEGRQVLLLAGVRGAGPAAAALRAESVEVAELGAVPWAETVAQHRPVAERHFWPRRWLCVHLLRLDALGGRDFSCCEFLKEIWAGGALA